MKKLGLPLNSSDIESQEYYTNLRRCLSAGLFMQVSASVARGPQRGDLSLSLSLCYNALLGIVYWSHILAHASPSPNTHRVRYRWRICRSKGTT